ncbi:serine hydrolase domain-containing protein [Microlunatus antarcticus]|uniref:CubicO group peptidase (Beta-lactamase class C family) n=1 Tax=Microlunatus antarcticus TaxID=53388 RepID=A0A7W5JZ33_9ACTN|nr:CubicO group peptidase (beta-lactamase class C family) [Microlunatus antarcticus]
MSATDLPRSTPESQGVDPRGITAFLDAMEAAPDIEMHSLMVLRHGQLVAEGWWSPYAPELPHLLYSLSKSFTSTALGLMVDEGLVDLDATVLSYFPELDADVTDPRSRSMRVRHVAAMASGHLAETLDRALANDPVDLVRGFLLVPPEREPGTVFAYNQPCTYTIAAIVQRLSGQTLVEFLRPRLFDPLGVGPVGWQQHPSGRDLGFTGLHATTDALSRLGQLYLQRGVWDGERLLSEAWVAEATSRQVDNPLEPNPDWSQGYGFQFWIARHGYRGDGAYGQFCVVLPEQDVVIAVTSATENMQGVLDAVWAHLLPAFGADALEPSPAAGALDERLAALGVAPLEGSAAPLVDPEDWSDRRLRPGPSGSAQRSLTEVRLVREDDRWRLVLFDDDAEISSGIGTTSWQTNLVETEHGETGVPIAVSGGWTDDDTFRADVIFLETPHRLELTASRTSATFDLRWQTVALRAGTLADLRMPRGQQGSTSAAFV